MEKVKLTNEAGQTKEVHPQAIKECLKVGWVPANKKAEKQVAESLGEEQTEE